MSCKNHSKIENDFINNIKFKGHCSKSKVQKKPDIKISDLIFGREHMMKLPKIKKDYASDPKFQEKVIRDLLVMAEKKKVGKTKYFIGDIKEEIFKSFKFEKQKVDSIVNYIDTILLATEKVLLENYLFFNYLCFIRPNKKPK